MGVKKDRGKRLRFAIVGAGRIADSYVQAFQLTQNAALSWIVDSQGEVAKAKADKAGCGFLTSYTDLLQRDDFDAAIVATPPSTHGTICLALLERGIPVLCEKPVSIEAETARQIEQRSRENNVLFTMASKFRYAEDVVRAHSMVNSGLLGEIVLFENTFMSYVDMSSRWNSDPAASGGGVLIDNGTHSVDIMRYFLGPLYSIHVIRGKQIQDLAVEDTVHVTARTESGAIGRMDLSWSINKQCDDYIAIYGCKGTLRVGWKGSYYRQESAANWVHFGNGYNKVQAFCNQIENFSAAVQGLERLVIDAGDAVASVDVIAAGYSALGQQTWVQVPSHEPELVSAAA